MISLPGLAYKPGARRVLLVGAGQAVLYHWEDNAAALQTVFTAGEQGRERFRQYLLQRPDTPFYLLLDMADEEYRQETIPHVSRRDRQALLERKAARLLKDSSWYCYRKTGREDTGRRDDRVLLIALANPGLLRQWLALLDETMTPLAGICSLPLFSGRLLGEVAGRGDGRRLLVSLHRVSGLRQTCFDNGEFHFSRLAPLPVNTLESYPALIRDEVEKVRRYLNSRQPVTPAQPLHIHFLLAGDLLQELQAGLAEQESVHYHFFDLVPVDGPRDPAQIPFSDRYFVQQLFRQRPGNDYASAADRRWFFLRRLRAGVAAAGCALLIGSVCWSALTCFNGMALKRKTDAAREQTAKYAAEYEQARARLPQTPVAAAELKQAVMIAGRLVRYRTTPLAMVSVLSHSLSRFPAVHLGKLKWMAAGHQEMTHRDTPAQAAPQLVAEVPGAAEAARQAAVLHARIEPFNGNLREAMDLVDRFAEDLRARERVRSVSVLTMPLDVSSGAALQGNTQAVRHEAGFSLRVVLEQAGET